MTYIPPRQNRGQVWRTSPLREVITAFPGDVKEYIRGYIPGNKGAWVSYAFGSDVKFTRAPSAMVVPLCNGGAS